MSKPDPYLFRCTIDRVIDGDTVDVIVDLGFDVKTKQRIRLAGIDAPEVRGPESQKGLEAKEGLSLWMLNSPWFWLKTEKGRSFDRYIGTLFTPEMQSVNQWLVDMEYAVPSKG